jgi:hypothetical protein
MEKFQKTKDFSEMEENNNVGRREQKDMEINERRKESDDSDFLMDD